MNFYDKHFDYKNNVLKNKIGLKRSSELEIFEAKASTIRLAELRNKKIAKNLSMKDYKEIHKYLFQDVYDWAGEYRTVDIHKGNTSFLPCQFINKAEEQLEQSIQLFLSNKNNSKEFICKELGKILCDLNYMHPFREGNGRTQREFIRQLADLKGYALDITPNNDLYMIASIKDDEILMYEALKKDIKSKKSIEKNKFKNEHEK
ncbi:Fic/DOC family protein [Siminovitchia fortis]|uniref:Fic/DOC family protein n=1 Tax=Siminovitchia fortis TaxID=254758 RepID=UPI001642A411|nr:Fic family protein [Siminovitchia fortis]